MAGAGVTAEPSQHGHYRYVVDHEFLAPELGWHDIGTTVGLYQAEQARQAATYVDARMCMMSPSLTMYVLPSSR